MINLVITSMSKPMPKVNASIATAISCPALFTKLLLMKDGKVQTFNCYPSATIMLAQLGVLSNLQASLQSS